MSLNRHPYIGSWDKGGRHDSRVHDFTVWMPQAYKPIVGDYILPPEVSSHTSPYTDYPANQLEASIFLLQRKVRIDRIGIWVDGAGGAGAKIRLGIYECDLDSWYPTNLVIDAGEVDATVTGNRTITVDLILDKGWYFLAFVTNDGAIDLRGRGYALSPIGYGASNLVVIQGWHVSYTYGPLPSTFPSGGARSYYRFGGIRIAELL